jgi:predicted nucleotidyltransferase
LSAEIGKYLDEVVREIKKYEVDAIYLFGSYATTEKDVFDVMGKIDTVGQFVGIVKDIVKY